MAINQLQIPTSGNINNLVDQSQWQSLSNLGNVYQKAQQDAANKAAFEAFQQTGDPKALIGSGDMNLAQLGVTAQNHLDTLRQQGLENKRADVNLGLLQHQDKRAEATAARAAYDAEHTPDKFIDNPDYGKVPGAPRYIDQLAAATAASGNPPKPIPFETLAGTKFIVPQPGGGYKIMDPSQIAGGGAPQAGAPQPAGGPSPFPQPAVSPSGAPQAVLPQPTPQPGAGPSIAQLPAVLPSPTPQVGGPQAPQPQALDTEAIDPETGRREGFLKSLDPSAQDYIKKIADYDADVRSSSVKSGKQSQLIAAVSKYRPDWSESNYPAIAKAKKDFATGQEGRNIRSFDVAADHLDTLKKYVEALNAGHNSSSPLLNDIRNRWLKATGNALPTNVEAIGPVVGAEVTKAIIGSNNALADREELRLPLKASNSLPQILESIGGYQDLMAGQMRGLKKQYEDTTQQKDFNKRISPNTRYLMASHGPPVRVASPADAAKLEPGTKLILPDGSSGVVPRGE